MMSQPSWSPQGYPKRTFNPSALQCIDRNAHHFDSMHAPREHSIQVWALGGKHAACMGSAGKGSGKPGGDNPKGEVASCKEDHSLASAAMQKRPTSKSLQCGSWVRVDMREVSYFSKERHGQKNVQTTIHRTLYRALALHARRGSFGDEEGRDRGGTVRTELVVPLMTWFPWPAFNRHVLL